MPTKKVTDPEEVERQRAAARERMRRVRAAKTSKVSEERSEADDAAQNDILAQLHAIQATLAKRGLSLEDVYESPPSAVTVEAGVEEPHTIKDAGQEVLIAREKAQVNQVGGPRPGTVQGEGPSQHMIEMTRAHLAEQEKITFSPHPVPGMVHPLTDDQGRQKIRLNVNGLECWLTCSIPNTVSVMFYNAYMDNYAEWRRLEDFKRNGPANAPWGMLGPDGRPAWMFKPAAFPTMDEDGREVPPTANPRPFLGEGFKPGAD